MRGIGKGSFMAIRRRTSRSCWMASGSKCPAGMWRFRRRIITMDRKSSARIGGRRWSSAATAGQKYLITPGFPEVWRKDKDTVLRYLEVFNSCGTFCKTFGVKFGYHNHTMEFDRVFDGATLYELILQHTDPSLVALQLDVGLLYAAGVSPQEMILQHPGRFELMHVKDEFRKPGGGERGQGYESTVLGNGELKLPEIVRMGRDTGGGEVLFC